MDNLYPHIQSLVFDLNSYALLEVTVLNTEICFIVISDIKLEILS